MASRGEQGLMCRLLDSFSFLSPFHVGCSCRGLLLTKMKLRFTVPRGCARGKGVNPLISWSICTGIWDQCQAHNLRWADINLGNAFLAAFPLNSAFLYVLGGRDIRDPGWQFWGSPRPAACQCSGSRPCPTLLLRRLFCLSPLAIFFFFFSL